jgi:SAM-dependent methyltransferase
MEQPAFLALLPEVVGRPALDRGCDAGQLAHYLAGSGAAEVVGVDVSEHMLEPARTWWAHPRVTYRRVAMEQVTFPAGQLDLVVSSLAFHYVADYAELVRRIARWLAPGGILVYSTEHPIYTPRSASGTADGWILDAAGKRVGWALDRYADDGQREHTRFVEGVRRYHRTVATPLNGLIDAGLTLEQVMEPAPSEAWLRERAHAADEPRRPVFLLVRARK